MSDTLIIVDNVSKKFCSDLKKSLWYGVKDIVKEVTGRSTTYPVLRSNEFWSVNDVSFELERGECLGLIGPNGAGKSTLLKMLIGLVKPDKGRISMRGRVGALIELGAGFNPVLTGRENIYINGAVLGLTKNEIRRKFDEIVEFAELSEFIDMPVQNYSSGMRVRLGFSVAAQLDPDILLIDEVLAVGDVGFRSKCFNAISEIQKKAAVIFVSHAMPQVARICTDTLLLNKGAVLYQGQDVSRGIEIYYSSFKSEKGTISGSGRAEIQSIKLTSNGNTEVPGKRFHINYLDDLTISLCIKADCSVDALSINVAFYDKELRSVAQVYSLNSDFRLVNDNDTLSIKVRIDQMNFNPGTYTLSLVLTDEQRGETLINYHAIRDFQVTGPFIGFSPIQIRGEWSRTSLE